MAGARTDGVYAAMDWLGARHGDPVAFTAIASVVRERLGRAGMVMVVNAA